MSEKQNLEELKKQVKCLIEQTDETQIVTKLQEIGATLLTKNEIEVGGVTIEPLLVEAYYYNEDEGKFKDDAIHAKQYKTGQTQKLAERGQKNNFGGLYIHLNKSGLDVCLSDKSLNDGNDYYLTFLIKNALVNGTFKTQTQIVPELCKLCNCGCSNESKCKYTKNDADNTSKRQLTPKENENDSKTVVIFLPRKNVGGDFGQKPLAAVLLTKDTLSYDLSVVPGKGFGKDWRKGVFDAVTGEISEMPKAIKTVRLK